MHEMQCIENLDFSLFIYLFLSNYLGNKLSIGACLTLFTSDIKTPILSFEKKKNERFF